MNRSIIRSAERYKKDILKRKKLNEVVNDYLYRLNTVIETAHKNNKVCAVLLLPVGFNIPSHINYKNFQTEVYYNIVEILEKKGHTVNIKMRDNESFLVVSWDQEESLDIENMKNKLKNIMI